MYILNFFTVLINVSFKVSLGYYWIIRTVFDEIIWSLRKRCQCFECIHTMSSIRKHHTSFQRDKFYGRFQSDTSLFERNTSGGITLKQSLNKTSAFLVQTIKFVLHYEKIATFWICFNWLKLKRTGNITDLQ